MQPVNQTEDALCAKSVWNVRMVQPVNICGYVVNKLCTMSVRYATLTTVLSIKLPATLKQDVYEECTNFVVLVKR